MPKLLFNLAESYVTESGVPVKRDMVEAENDADLLLLFISYTDSNALPVAGKLRIREGRPTAAGGSLAIIEIECGFYAVLPRYNRACGKDKVLLQRAHRFGEELFVVTVIDNGGLSLMAENETDYLELTLPDDLTDADITFIDQTNRIAVKGRTADGQYLAIISGNGEFKPLLEITGDTIEMSGGILRVKKRLHDMLRRTVRREYSENNGGYECCLCEYTSSADIKYIDELIPYLFLESVILGDYGHAETLLSAELAAAMPSVAEYFKGIDRIWYSEIFPVKPFTVYGADKDITVIKKFHFKVECSVITDIDADN